MSVHHEVDNIIDTQEEAISVTEPNNILELAVQEAKNLFAATGESLNVICAAVEGASDREELVKALGRLNRIMHIFLEVTPVDAEARTVLDAVSSLQSSTRFQEVLRSQGNLTEAIRAYKTLVAKDLAVGIQRKKKFLRISEAQDCELLDTLLPKQEAPVCDLPVEATSLLGHVQESASSGKRGVSHIADEEGRIRIPKKLKSTIPALAAIGMVSGSDSTGLSGKKLLMTRERLRAGLHDPRGLLNLVGSSTDALERTKKLELLKSAGFCFDGKNKNASFSEKFNAATWRLDLGLGGHVYGDTILFGKKVLSNPGALTPKNVTDIENNIIDGKTTWKHQNEYVKMMIAGSLNQAKRILGKYDKILFGPSPEEQVENAHKTVRELLVSREGKTFQKEVGRDDPEVVARGDKFIKKIIAAIPPIIPVALRNKSLDGAYLRTALHFLGAAELMFSRYETDVRRQANPAGVVGLCNAMHLHFEQCAIGNKDLLPLEDFIKEMTSQYQTSLGLGLGFPNDTTLRKGRRKDYFGRGRTVTRARHFMGQALGRGQQGVLGAASGATGRGSGLLHTSPRGRNVCFGYQAGTCGRGSTCRFLHIN